MKNILNVSKLISKCHLDYFRTIHSLKTAFACIIGMIIVHVFQLPNGQWIPITIMVVMSAQAHFGAALAKAYMRLLGTVFGITLVLITLLLLGNEPITVFMVIFIAVILFTYLASGGGDISYAGTLGGVTVILTLTGLQVTPQFALLRGAYIISGIIIALLVSRFIYPIHARDILRIDIANSLRGLRKLYLKVLTIEETTQTTTSIDARIEEELAKTIASQPVLIHEAAVGSKIFAQKKAIFHDILSSLHSLRRLICLMHQNLNECRNRIDITKQLAEIDDLHIVITENLEALANCFEARTIPNNVVDLHNAIEKINRVVTNFPKVDTAEKLIVEHSFLFLLQQILKEINDLQLLTSQANALTQPTPAGSRGIQ